MNQETDMSRPWIELRKLESNALSLFMLKEITPEQYKAVLKQLNSPDYENHVVAQEIIMTIIKAL